ncbi:unnamed protein product [Zymoseptoria tritici ST99CH_1A5]|uniref:Uncharacterized protein n=1 Tax=Zymoseptoria tritici ST99CH_1A5 TaxID=1276529 RepID=A0A1Y6L8Y7_ZYMTR|nr:unnamed protein product [Zymoseptoria tritici ST99CH_1A5]
MVGLPERRSEPFEGINAAVGSVRFQAFPTLTKAHAPLELPAAAMGGSLSPYFSPSAPAARSAPGWRIGSSMLP